MSNLNIQNLLKVAQDEQITPNSTFLEIIAKSYDENYISRLLAYTIQVDNAFLNKLIALKTMQTSTCKLQFVTCEKSVIGGRIDVFAIAQNACGETYTITIENKIRSWEHDDQTITYYNYINKNYKTSHNIFILLKPKYNLSKCSCKEFIQLSYETLCNLITLTNNNIIKDFKQHIFKYFMTKDIIMTKSDIEILKHYNQIKDLLTQAESKLQNEQLRYFSIIKNSFIKDEDDWDTQIDNSSFRIYKKEWWANNDNPSKKYYFYSELYFINNDPNEIVIQSTIKKYGQKVKDSIVYKFIEKSSVEGIWHNAYFVHYKAEFKSQFEIFSIEWKNELEKFILDKMQESLEKTEILFENFSEVKNNF